jgi:CNT family concentrative nucleoside transporter
MDCNRHEIGMAFTLDNLRSLIGVAFVFGLAWAISTNRKQFPWRIAAVALVMEIVLAASMLVVPPLRAGLGAVSAGLDGLQAATLEGSRFVFGYLAGGAAPFDVTQPQNSTVLAFGILPLIIVVSALSALLWKWGVLEWMCRGLGFVLRKTMGISGALGLATGANIFLGMVEAPLVVRPYLQRMSRADLFVIMTTGMATIAGTVMALYASFLSGTSPDAAGHILVASFMAAPGSIAIARVMMPAAGADVSAEVEKGPKLYRSSVDAFARGIQDGVNMLIAVVAMLLGAVAFVALANMILAGLLPEFGGSEITIGRIFGWIFAPLMWMLGVPWNDALPAGELMGTKTALNELLAYLQMSQMSAEAIEPRTRLMMIYALCGFANFASVAIMIGGLSAMCPDRRDDFADLGLRSLVAGTLTNMLGAALIGMAPMAMLAL